MSQPILIKAHPMGDNTWILHDPVGRVGLLSVSDQKYKFLGKGTQTTSMDVASLESMMNWHICFSKPPAQILSKLDQFMIDHMPIKHADPQNIQLEPWISYTKTSSSSIRFAAGWWAILFNHWQGAFCPKISTLDSHEHVGPFSNKLELNTILSAKNQKLD